MNENHKKGLLISTLSILIMSAESPLIKMANLHWADTSFLVGIGLIFSINFIMILKGKEFFIDSYKNGFLNIALAGFFMGFGNLSFISAVIYGGVANTVLILATSPIFSSIIVWILYKKPTNKKVFIATFFIFIGLYIVLQKDLSGGSFLGIILAFTCMGFMIGVFITLSHFKNISKIAFISIAGLCLSAFSLPFTQFDLNLKSTILILLIGVFIMPYSRYLMGIGAKNILPQELSLLVILESVVAPFLAWWWIGDKPSFETFLGGFIILSTLFLYILSPNKKIS